MSGLTLTNGQQNAYEAFVRFIVSTIEVVFVVEGYSGTGKSTLIQVLLDRLPKILKSVKLVDPSQDPKWEVVLTATTNKAAEAFSKITGHDVRTIHSVLGLRVSRDFKTGRSKLVANTRTEIVKDTILFIDEASYADKVLLGLIFERTENCKIVLIGDPAQLLTVGSTIAPAFLSGFNTAKLTEVVRQAEGNPIIDLATAFRETVNTGEFFSFVPDGTHIKVVDRDTFENAIIAEFNDPQWHHDQSKVLAWTNQAVIKYNQAIRNNVKGAPEFAVGDYAICNQFIGTKQCNLKTDQLVHITYIGPSEDQHGVTGKRFVMDNKHQAFMPDSITDKKQLLSKARKDSDWSILSAVENWVDLRAAYACTINKAQGSTYDTVFIDLDDLKKCNSGNQIARMMYVAVSRARYTVYLCGDLV